MVTHNGLGLGDGGAFEKRPELLPGFLIKLNIKN
jgi:hypothetical protein